MKMRVMHSVILHCVSMVQLLQPGFADGDAELLLDAYDAFSQRQSRILLQTFLAHQLLSDFVGELRRARFIVLSSHEYLEPISFEPLQHSSDGLIMDLSELADVNVRTLDSVKRCHAAVPETHKPP